MNTFYVGNIQDFETKADKYLTRSDDYKVLININDENNEKSFDGALKEMIESMNSLFEKLKTHKAVSDDLYKRLVADLSKIKLPYLYFLPNISKENGISLVPIITSRSSAAWKIGKYLNQLLRPFVDEILQSTKFTDDTDFFQRFNHYANTERRLRPTTIFCAIKITNFYTLDEHQNMIDVIGYFLQDNLATNELESLIIQTIRNLLYLFLYNNIFCYIDNIYTFTKGTPNAMALTETLSNIYLFSVNHDPNIPRYTLPYVMGHSKSAHIDDFQQERIYLELTYLINSYSLLFVETHVKHFFNYFHAQIMRYSANQSTYDKFCPQWFKFVEQQHELSEQLQKFDNNGRLIQFNYIYDFGSRCRFNRDFYQLWFHYFQ
ncbi:unnamed protein product [Rotaria sp. Silwood2]|nr:unnamed protein product [Rotaria sp. Silwood2]CAF2988049.1 unnamed protein product [Rotaria sp. Silwood2]CAF3377907.1 unnamed protein product [Rotaria sp. Silwood2]CAF4205332.1 unnamed protein product [Rotaria sp. Silwood2]CAF4530584.1 unnamed protein product [Rotaria sp. Silwood2]